MLLEVDFLTSFGKPLSRYGRLDTSQGPLPSGKQAWAIEHLPFGENRRWPGAEQTEALRIWGAKIRSFLLVLPMNDQSKHPDAPLGSAQNPWRRADGTVISCEEKLKVLRENLAELRQMALDALEDAVLMGCDEKQVKQAFLDEIAALSSGYSVDWHRDPHAGAPASEG
jgi:hypothetical protein